MNYSGEKSLSHELPSFTVPGFHAGRSQASPIFPIIFLPGTRKWPTNLLLATSSARCAAVRLHMRLKLVILWALLLYWSLKEIPNELNAHSDALALCRWNRDWDVIADTLGNSGKTCTWILGGLHGRPGEVWTMASKVMLWLDDSIRAITTAF